MVDELLIRAQQAVDRTAAYLRSQQDDQGRWLGAHRSTHIFYYVMGLVVDGETKESAIVQDICDFLETWAAPDGGFGDYPGEPPNAYHTSLAIPFISWARPNSPVLPLARKFLKGTGMSLQDPTIAMARYLFEPDMRAKVLADSGPPGWLRKLALLMSRRHPTERWNIAQMYPGYYRQVSGLRKILEPIMLRGVCFPPTDMLEQAAAQCAGPTGFDMMLLIYAALRKLAADTSDGANRLYEFAMHRRTRCICEDWYEWLSPLLGDLFFTTAFGLEEERRKAARAIRQIKYEGDGWMNGDIVTVHVFDTALTILGLLSAGIPAQDPMIQKAVDFLKRARSPEHGLWTWAYGEGMGARRPKLDTDDCGAALMCLAAVGEPANSPILRIAAENLLALQDAKGSFSLFGDGVIRPNWSWLSNTSRALQGLLAAGIPGDHPDIVQGMEWIESERLADGSWIDGWCVRYVYGTVMALEALLAGGRLKPGDPQTIAAVDWLVSHQNEDGGWGETWAGGRCHSKAEQTALAIYGLCIASHHEAYPLPAIRSGLNWLIENQRQDGAWDASYFMNFGFGVGVADAQLPIAFALYALGHGIRVLKQSA